MKKSQLGMLAVVLAFGGAWIYAQDRAPRHQPDAEDGPNDGPPPHHRFHPHRPPPPPVMVVLDANHDGRIDAEELANAVASLKQLDRNNDGQLTFDELRPPFPPPDDCPPPFDDDDDFDGPHPPHHHRGD